MAAEILMPTAPPFRQSASVHAAHGRIIFSSDVVYGRTGRDEQGMCIVMPDTAGESELGSLLRQALDASRFLTLEQAEAYFDLKSLTPRYETWIKDMVAKFGVKSRREFFRGMKHLIAVRRNGTVTLSPMQQERREGWVGLGDELAVTVQDSDDDTALGVALRLALARCIG